MTKGIMDDATRKALEGLKETLTSVTARDAIVGVKFPDLAPGQVPRPGSEATRHASQLAAMMQQHAQQQTQLAEESALKLASLMKYQTPSAAQLEMLAATHHYQATADRICGIPLGKMVTDKLPASCAELTLDRIAGYSVRLRDHVVDLRSAVAKLEAEVAMLRAHPPLVKAGGIINRWNADTGHWEPAAMPDAKPDDGPKADYHGPDDAAHRAVHNVTEHLLGGRVSDTKARRCLRDALDKADRPAEGRKASDQAIGRALRFGSQTIGLRLP